jgi:hypothetical protein
MKRRSEHQPIEVDQKCMLAYEDKEAAVQFAAECLGKLYAEKLFR